MFITSEKNVCGDLFVTRIIIRVKRSKSRLLTKSAKMFVNSWLKQ